MTTSGSGRILLLAVLLVGLGFALGIGYQTLQYAQQQTSGTEDAEPRPPLVRSLRVSPDGRLLAFTAIYHNLESAGRFLFDLETYQWNEAKSPDGWQDSITQWSSDGTRLLFSRERIPRPPSTGQAGLYEEKIFPPQKQPAREEPEELPSVARPSGERAYAGFWTPDNRLVMKTRRETKSLFLQQPEGDRLLDHSPGTYYQNRAIEENGETVYYAVRDISVSAGTVGIFRVQNGISRQIGSTFKDIIWAYLAENARWLLVCHYAENEQDWLWSLYSVSPTEMKLIRQAQVPGDVIAVYWSPDFKQILGAAGKSLWLVDIPSLETRQLGERDDWYADDAAWLGSSKAVLIAAAGKLWKVETATGKRTEMWKFPREYWR